MFSIIAYLSVKILHGNLIVQNHYSYTNKFKENYLEINIAT